MMVIDYALDAAAVLLLIPVAVIFAQIIFAYLPNARGPLSPPTNTRVAVLVPAHDEADGIAATIKTILPQLKSGDRLLVVADNCSDNTARIASENGAEVIERHDPDRRGKGFALDFGIHFLAQNPPEVAVIIDADCIVEHNALSKLVAYAAHRNRPVQCLYLMFSPNEKGLKGQIAEFAWVVKNLVRPLGYARLGLPCQLMGSGMAFPWSAINNIDLASDNLVEDLKLGIDLSKSGKSPLFYEDALVTSYFPETAEARAQQRTRWEHGHLGMIVSKAPKLILQGIIKGNKDLVAMTLDLCVPPLSLLVVMLSGLTMLSGFYYLVGSSCLPLLLAICASVILVLTILLAWWGWGRQILSPLTLLVIPVYVVSKIPHYIRFLFNRQKQWIRTDRQKK
jgi:cellulose synthase/poly-beta-1,6-N-acetylglucosamine synthase-like glycosyltransferase